MRPRCGSLAHDYFTMAETVDSHYVNSLLLQLEELVEELEKVSFKCQEVVPPASANNHGASITSEDEAVAAELERIPSPEPVSVQDLCDQMGIEYDSDQSREHKWQDKLFGKVEECSRGKATAAAFGSAQGSDTGGPKDGGRPIGRDRAKKLRSVEGGSSSSLVCLEVSQRLTVALKKEHLMLQREAIEVQKNPLQFKVAKASSADTEREDQIMSMDLEGLSERKRRYWEARQNEIIDRRLNGM
ncbi:hypothetical protein BAE44_0000971 [Dichanthelium oligosanthes]|uniref:No apical meristem-associated C-terminal domain-containing protein n=1 Tax=Dichanthelium oligosanthes TaxID=888268 RepID=A0A1E5WLK0_9POAL|nr:hypothetical protein BAE44_0000971 [Dichanthelium oligosanthes]